MNQLLMKALRVALVASVLSSATFALAQEATPEATQNAATPADICANAGAPAEPETRTYEAPEQVLEEGVDYRAVLCTGAGPVYVDLFEQYTPITVNSFVFLAQEGYYNNTTFHRVIEGFMAQGGDPTGTGRGGPGYQFQNEQVGFLQFDSAGWLAMANAGANTNGSQFFITTAAAPHLNGGYTIFGEVLEGQENVDAIELRDPASATEPGTSLDTVVIITDPAAVTTTYESPAPASQEQFETDIELINAGIPAPLAADLEASGVFSSEVVVAGAPETLREAYAALLEENNFEFRAQHRVVNAECDVDTAPYSAISYTMDVFATREDASAVLADGLLQQLPVEAGMTENETFGLAYPVYTENVTACDTEMIHALTYWQRGRYVITAQATYSNTISASPDQWLTIVVGNQIYESLFADVLRPEIR